MVLQIGRGAFPSKPETDTSQFHVGYVSTEKIDVKTLTKQFNEVLTQLFLNTKYIVTGLEVTEKTTEKQYDVVLKIQYIKDGKKISIFDNTADKININPKPFTISLSNINGLTELQSNNRRFIIYLLSEINKEIKRIPKSLDTNDYFKDEHNIRNIHIFKILKAAQAKLEAAQAKLKAAQTKLKAAQAAQAKLIEAARLKTENALEHLSKNIELIKFHIYIWNVLKYYYYDIDFKNEFEEYNKSNELLLSPELNQLIIGHPNEALKESLGETPISEAEVEAELEVITRDQFIGQLQSLVASMINGVNNQLSRDVDEEIPTYIDDFDIDSGTSPFIEQIQSLVASMIQTVNTKLQNIPTIDRVEQPMASDDSSMNTMDPTSIVGMIQTLIGQLNTKLGSMSVEEAKKTEDPLLGEVTTLMSNVIDTVKPTSVPVNAATPSQPDTPSTPPSSLSTKEINQIISEMIALVNQGINPMVALLKSLKENQGITEEGITKLIETYAKNSKEFNSFIEALKYYDKNVNTVTESFKDLSPEDKVKFVKKYTEQAKTFLEELQKQQKGGSKVQQGIQSLKRLRKNIQSNKHRS